MQNVFIINGHHKYPFSEGKLNASLIKKAWSFFENKGYIVQFTSAEQSYEVKIEIEKFKWADMVFVQTPINWMGTPWTLKRYIDDVWNAGMIGELSDGDGRTSAAPKKNYGLGGKLTGRYMLSLTANAPREAFNNPEERFFDGISPDDLLLPLHLNFKWLGLTSMPTFIAHDVMKDPQIESDFKRFEGHLATHF